MLACVARARAEPLSADDLARKNDGGYVTGLPLAAYSTDIGLGAGARAYYYWNGDRSDPRFATTPYLYRDVPAGVRVDARRCSSTGSTSTRRSSLDTPYRIRSQLIYARNTNQNYFGVGSRTLAPLAFPGSAKTYGTYSRLHRRAAGDRARRHDVDASTTSTI